MSSPEEGSFLGSKGKFSRPNVILLGSAIFGGVICIVGIILLCNYKTYDGYEIVKDYTDCNSSETVPPVAKCKDILTTTGKSCSCYIQISVTEPMKAPVTVFYELDSYDQIISSYSKSRDDKQLAGHLSSNPADSCGAFSYVKTASGMKPIAPCGQLADAMFNDTFYLQTKNDYVSSLFTGLISEDDKKGFHNPPGNLSQAFKDFSKPINWRQNVWELDTENPENNGFQNEAFIVWMKTDLKRKPAWRINHVGMYKHGVPVANYTLRVVHEYPKSRYNGPRKFIISSVHVIVNSVTYGFGVALLVIGLLCLVSLAGLLLYRRRS